MAKTRDIGPLEPRGEPSRLPLPPAERRRRIREFWIGIVLVVAMGLLFLLPPITGLTQGVGDSGLFLFLNAVIVMMILIFGFLVTRNFWKLVGERRRGILGSHLNLKFVAAFVLISLVTTSGLFIVSAFFITSSIDKWFSVQVDRALEESGEIAENSYEWTAKNALFFGQRIADRITAERLMREGQLPDLEALVQDRQREYNLGVVEVFSATGEELVSAINPDIPAANFSRPDGALVSEAMGEGAVSWRVDEVGSGDVIRAVVPIESSFKAGESVGAVVVNVMIPFSQARRQYRRIPATQAGRRRRRFQTGRRGGGGRVPNQDGSPGVHRAPERHRNVEPQWPGHHLDAAATKITGKNASI